MAYWIYFVGLPLVVFCVSLLVHVSMLLPFRRMPRYSVWWCALMALGIAGAWHSFAACSWYWLVLTRDYSGPAGNVGLILIALPIPFTLAVMPFAPLLAGLLIAFPMRPDARQENGQRTGIRVVLSLLVVVHTLFVAGGLWFKSTGFMSDFLG